MLTSFSIAGPAQEVSRPYAEYTIDITPSLKELFVRACFNSDRPEYLNFGSATDKPDIYFLDPGTREIRPDKITAGRNSISELWDESCIHYRAGLDNNSRGNRRTRRLHANLRKNNIVVPSASWLMLPPRVAKLRMSCEATL